MVRSVIGSFQSVLLNSIAMNLCVCRFWKAVFRCSLDPNEEHRKPCTTGQRIITSGLTVPNAVALSIRSAQAVATIIDYIAENYCDSSIAPSFMVRHHPFLIISNSVKMVYNDQHVCQ